MSTTGDQPADSPPPSTDAKRLCNNSSISWIGFQMLNVFIVNSFRGGVISARSPAVWPPTIL